MRFIPHVRLRPQILSFLRSRLSQRIVLSVFGSIIAIEGIILIPSVYRRERELLNYLADKSATALAVLMQEADMASQADLGSDKASGGRKDMPSPEETLALISQLLILPDVAGGAVYTTEGIQVGTFGEPPATDYQTLIEQQSGNSQKVAHLNRRTRRYNVTWMTPLGGQYWVVIGHDVTSVRNEVIAFIGRIAWLVLIISVVVTLSTMIVLRSILIAPILALCDDLFQAAPAALEAENTASQTFISARYSQRNDELGAVVSAFFQMFERITNNIQKRQQAENKLRESETRFRTLVEQASESIFVLDEKATLLDVNQFALRTLGYTSTELVNQSLFTVNPAFTPEQYKAHWERLKAGKPVTVESIHRRKDGSDYPVEVRSNFIVIEGQERALALVRDISDRKQAEKAQARLAEIGELAAMIVHEVRNPFTTVYMALSTFQTMDLPPRGQMRLELAMEESDRLKRLLNEILAYSKEQKLAGEAVDISELSRELVRSLQDSPAATDRQIQLLDCDESVVVMGDRDKLKQVFINLITNACEAIPPQETVTWQMTLPTAQHIEIQIHNGGDPIPPDVLPKLTQPFVSTKSNGNGLGLAITKRIIEAHGGELSITSTAEQGTTVTFRLPRT
ncbi:MAG: ATP-binding protein [Cyanobacteria bacterium J06632_3]